MHPTTGQAPRKRLYTPEERARRDTTRWTLIQGLLAPAQFVAFAVSVVLVKSLTRTDAAVAISFWMLVVQSAIGLVPALMVWETPVGITWLWIVLAGSLGSIAHMFWTRALRLGDASMLTPISFLQIIVVGAFGWWLFGETLDRWTVAGAAIIFGSNVYIARREAKLARQAVTDPEINPETPAPR